MGQRISFFRNNFNHSLSSLIQVNYTNFRMWYLNLHQESVEEYGEAFGDNQVLSLLNEVETIHFSMVEKSTLDRLVSDFIGFYCDMTDPKGQILEFFGPSFNKSRYRESTELVIKTKDEYFIRLWNYLIVKGRSLYPSEEFSEICDYTIGYLSIKEQEELKHFILNYFGDLEQMKDSYWNRHEKELYNRAVCNSMNGVIQLTGHYPLSSGLEYVLTVLNENEGKSELISAIE